MTHLLLAHFFRLCNVYFRNTQFTYFVTFGRSFIMKKKLEYLGVKVQVNRIFIEIKLL